MGTRAIGRLSPLKIKNLTKAGRYCDGGGLYLQINRSGAKSWIFRYQLDGRVRDMGLGSAVIICVADARDFAGKCRALVCRQIDPIDERARKKRERLLEAASATTLRYCAFQCFEQKRIGWRNQKHAKQWITTLEQYAFPSLGGSPVRDIQTTQILKVLEPIWTEKHETATRVRERLEMILDWARARGLRDGENPARWRGHLETLLPKPNLIRKVRHHPALPYIEIGAFVTALRKQEGMAARALELVIYTAIRTSEVLNAGWREFDLDRGIWTIPSSPRSSGSSCESRP